MTRKFTVILIMMMVVCAFTLSSENTFAASKPGKAKISTIKAKGTYSVYLKWGKVKNAKKYQVYRAKGNSNNFKKIATTTKRTYTDTTGLKQDAKYRYKVRGINKKKKGKFSSIKTVWTKAILDNDDKPSTDDTNKPSPGEEEKPAVTEEYTYKGCLEVPEDTNTFFVYGNTQFHIGQTWTNELHSQILSNSSGEEVIVRNDYATFRKSKIKAKSGVTVSQETNVVDETVYMFNTNTYDNFLVVYVLGDRISHWMTTGDYMGQNGESVMHRGDTEFPKNGKCIFKNMTSQVSDVPTNGAVIGGFTCSTNIYTATKTPSDFTNEKIIGFHYINAYRKTAGRNPLEYNKYIDGENMTVSGVITDLYDGYGNPKEDIVVNNSRFGAQAWAETMESSRVLGHGISKMTDGPMIWLKMYDNNYNTLKIRTELTSIASNNKVSYYGEDCSGAAPSCAWGEETLCCYEPSSKHLSAMLLKSHDYIGIGITENYNAVGFGSAIEE